MRVLRLRSSIDINRGRFGRLIAAGLFCALFSSCGGGNGGGGSSAPPPTVTAQTLYSFGGTPMDAMGPVGHLSQGSDGNFYGTSYQGGIGGGGTGNTAYKGNGTVFKITPTGEETVLYRFTGYQPPPNPVDGANPMVVIEGSDGNLYGTTALGGAFGQGTVFKLTPEGVETVLYSFTGESDGSYPAGGLIQGADGNFYGTTQTTKEGGGTVFKLTPQGVLTTLYSFTGTNEAGPDGALPVGQLVQGSDGNFYGATYFGGLPSPDVQSLSTCGTVFKVTPEGIETILHSFSGPDGQNPNGVIQGSDGNFYGTTVGANTNFGTVFMVTPEGVETTFYTFSATGSGGVTPFAGLVQASDGNFYGTTSGGGVNEGGTVFQLTPSGVVNELYSFPSTTFSIAPPGGAPNLVQAGDGNLYGAAYAGGAYDRGYFFKLVLSSP